jgi:hypothetical protein
MRIQKCSFDNRLTRANIIESEKNDWKSFQQALYKKGISENHSEMPEVDSVRIGQVNGVNMKIVFQFSDTYKKMFFA